MKRRNLPEALSVKIRQNIRYDLTIKMIQIHFFLIFTEGNKVNACGLLAVCFVCVFLQKVNIMLFIHLLTTADFQTVTYMLNLMASERETSDSNIGGYLGNSKVHPNHYLVIASCGMIWFYVLSAKSSVSQKADFLPPPLLLFFSFLSVNRLKKERNITLLCNLGYRYHIFFSISFGKSKRDY